MVTNLRRVDAILLGLKERLADLSWIQNRLLDCNFVIFVLLLFNPLGLFYFDPDVFNSNTVRIPDWYIGILLGAMTPEFLFVGVLGIIGLLHHARKQWHHENPRTVLFLFTMLYLTGFYSIGIIHALFFPDAVDCILSFIWGASPCTRVDIDATRFQLVRAFLASFVLPFVVISLNIFLWMLENHFSPEKTQPSRKSNGSPNKQDKHEKSNDFSKRSSISSSSDARITTYPSPSRNGGRTLSNHR